MERITHVMMMLLLMVVVMACASVASYPPGTATKLSQFDRDLEELARLLIARKKPATTDCTIQCPNTDPPVCLREDYMCDGVKDCTDGWDEDQKECKKICPKLACPDTGRCMPKEFMCDKVKDCKDGWDESKLQCPDPCPADYTRCEGDTLCIDNAFVCDGSSDCKNGWDEKKETCLDWPCPADKGKCSKTGQCIYKEYFCDGSPDCSGGDDEKNCPKKNREFSENDKKKALASLLARLLSK